MQKYLRDGDWVDLFYGEHQEKKIGYICRGQAYYWDGLRRVNLNLTWAYYPLRTVYSQEMYNADNGVENLDVQKTKTKTQT